jgi:transcriptional regulator with XRE-family HTH domain
MTFGRTIAEARKKAKFSLRELADHIRKEDGFPISPQYLNDLEHDRRNIPADFMLQQFAQVLDIPIEILYYYAGEIPSELRGMQVESEQVIEAYKAFRRTIQGDQKRGMYAI